MEKEVVAIEDDVVVEVVILNTPF